MPTPGSTPGRTFPGVKTMRFLILATLVLMPVAADARPRRVYVAPAPVVVRPSPQPVVVSTCPGGVCPRPVYVAPVRRSFFWGW